MHDLKEISIPDPISNTEITSFGNITKNRLRSKHEQMLEILNKYKVNTTDRAFILLKAHNYIATPDDLERLIHVDKVLGETSKQYNAQYITDRLNKEHNKQALNEIALLVLDELHTIDSATIEHLTDKWAIEKLTAPPGEQDEYKETIYKETKKNNVVRKSETKTIKVDESKIDTKQWE